jgi:maleylacetate reductase
MTDPRRSFVYEARPARVLFGTGTTARLGEEIDRLGAARALLLSGPRQAAEAGAIAEALGPRVAGTFAGAAMHTPVDVTETALAEARRLDADVLLALGGGSTTGLGKALALRTDLPQIVLPTTYAGSEMTPILGETRDGRKTTQTTPKVLPEVVIYDVERTLGLPVALSVTSGLNAMAHAAEALYARDGNPVTDLMAEAGLAALARALPGIVAAPSDLAARGEALYGAWLCGTCLGAVGMALHHKLCHTLGGTFDLPHAETHAVVLPHALAYNAPAAPEAMARIARALGAPPGSEAASALHALAATLGAPRALRDLGMPETGIDRAADLAIENPYWNPRPVERAPLRALLARAWAGDPPATP